MSERIGRYTYKNNTVLREFLGRLARALGKRSGKKAIALRLNYLIHHYRPTFVDMSTQNQQTFSSYQPFYWLCYMKFFPLLKLVLLLFNWYLIF